MEEDVTELDGVIRISSSVTSWTPPLSLTSLSQSSLLHLLSCFPLYIKQVNTMTQIILKADLGPLVSRCHHMFQMRNPDTKL